jgi:hypothetical protein
MARKNPSMCHLQALVNGKRDIHVLSSDLSKWKENIHVSSIGLSKWKNINVSSHLSKWRKNVCAVFRLK